MTWVAGGKFVNWVVVFCPRNAMGGTRNPSGRRSPFKAKRIGASGINGKKTEKPEKGAGGGRGKKSTFSYAVAALDDKGALYALDPDIRVRGGPG